MKNKIIVESEEIYRLGIHEKAFDPAKVIVVDNTWHRIRKPTDGKPYSVILWSRDHPNDTKPTEAKIVCVSFINIAIFTLFYSLVLLFSM
jgi:hypothetical protein